MDQGLPSATVNDIARRNDDVVFFATEAGVAQYSSDRFTNFDLMEFGGSANSNKVKRIVVDREDRVWATLDGVFVTMARAGNVSTDWQMCAILFGHNMWADCQWLVARRFSQFVSFDLNTTGAM